MPTTRKRIAARNRIQVLIIPFDEFVQLIENGDVKEVTIYSEHLTGVLKDEVLDSGRAPGSSANFKVNITPGLGKEEWFNVNYLLKYGVKYNNKPPNLLMQILFIKIIVDQ